MSYYVVQLTLSVLFALAIAALRQFWPTLTSYHGATFNALALALMVSPDVDATLAYAVHCLGLIAMCIAALMALTHARRSPGRESRSARCSVRGLLRASERQRAPALCGALMARGTVVARAGCKARPVFRQRRGGTR